VVSLKGSWFDESQNRIVLKGSDICTDSRIVRRGKSADSDYLEVSPIKSGEKSVRYDCRSGVTCVGPLNLQRIPVVVASNSTIQDFATFLKSRYVGWQDDHDRLSTVIHRGPEQRVDVLMAQNGFLPVTSVVSNDATFPLFVEFCVVRPGDICPDPARPIESDGLQPLQVSPGFYKVVIVVKTPAGYLRTEDQSYMLVVGDRLLYDRVAAAFQVAKNQTASAPTDDSAVDLITYLYSLHYSLLPNQ